MAPDIPSANPTTCPSCHQPVKPGLKFCESCGAKIVPASACPQCGAPLAPHMKFCETCGMPAGQSPPPNVEPPAAPPGISAAPETQGSPVIPPKPEPVSPPAPKTPASKGAAPAPAAGGSRNLVIAGVVVLAVLAAVVFFVVLPMLSGPGSTPAGSAAGTAQGSSPANTGSPETPVSPGSAEPSFEVKPTSIIPVNYMVTYQAERNGITGLVTITFAGGPGLNGIRETVITLTKSDGTVETRSWKPKENGDSITLKGTIGTDHLEAVANFYNGDQYRVLDKVFEYKKKN